MKIGPSNQTLLLASEQPKASVAAAKRLDSVIDAAARGGTLRRVVIVASPQPDDAVYVQADYDVAHDAANSGEPGSAATPIGQANAVTPANATVGTADTAATTVTAATAATAGVSEVSSVAPLQGASGLVPYEAVQPVDSVGRFGADPSSASDGTRLSSSFPPAEQYARTQRSPVTSVEVMPYVDVRV